MVTDALGNKLAVGSAVMLRLPHPDARGVVQAISEGSVLSSITGKDKVRPGFVTIIARFDVPVDPHNPTLHELVATLDPSLPPQPMPEPVEAEKPRGLEPLN